ncbi:MAG: fibronectin type III domain-containing protein [Clostridia bacterium]|nr:fibronectin type III domain-containing protein [Clostridia bacterium]
MEKSTKRFLSILLCIAMLMSFPVVASANTAYDETFKGTYTAPSQSKNTLISGDDARLTEWYGDRVNAGSKTYSVRQNQYGLNKDGNMIDAQQETKYTLWLSQYGVATLRFVVPKDGQYVITTSRNEKYSNDNEPDVYGIDKDGRTLSTSLGVYDDKYGSADLESGLLKDETNSINYATNLTKKYKKGDILYIAAGTKFCGIGKINKENGYSDSYLYWSISSSGKDMVYDIEIINKDKIEPETCTHSISSYISQKTSDNPCIYIETRKCKFCDKSFTVKNERHSYEYFQIKVPKEAKDGEKQTVTWGYKCSRCGVYSDYDISTYFLSSPHKLGTDKKLVDPNSELFKDFWSHYNYKKGELDGGSDALYEGTCTICGKYICQTDASPCTDENYNVKHDFGVDESTIDCEHPATCKVCGYTAGPHKYPKKYNEDTDWYDDVYSESNYKGTKCEETYLQCTVCGEHKIKSVYHQKATYVQVTPQHDNVCGTYKIHCDECDEDLTAVLTCHSYYTVENEDGTIIKKCARCGQVYSSDNGNNGGNNGGNQGGGSSGGGDAPAPAPTPEPGTSDNNANNNTTTSNNNSSTQNQPKLKKIVVNKVKAQKKAVVVAWKAVKNVTGYQIQLATDKKFKKNKKTVTVTNKKATKKTVKKLKSKKKYYVRVRAYKTQNGKRTYSSWSKTKSFKTK